MTTYPISFTARQAATERLDLGWRQSVSTSPFSLTQQVVNTAAQWRLQWTWPRMTHADAEAVAAWIDSLAGQVGTFVYSPHMAPGAVPSGLALGQAAYQFNGSMVVSGFASNGSTGLTAGRFGQIGQQLIRVTSAPVSADGNGNATVSFVPPLRATYGQTTTVNFTNPQGLFRLASSEGAGFSLDPDRLPTLPTMNAVEAIL